MSDLLLELPNLLKEYLKNVQSVVEQVILRILAQKLKGRERERLTMLKIYLLKNLQVVNPNLSLVILLQVMIITTIHAMD